VQLLGILLVALLTWTNTRGLDWGKLIQNVFTTTKGGALLALIAVGLVLGWNAGAVGPNFGDLWTPRGQVDLVPGLSAVTAFGLLVAIAVSQTGSLFSSDAWNNITFTAGEVRDPRRNLPLSLALGTLAVVIIYVALNALYLYVIPLPQLAAVKGSVIDVIADRLFSTAAGNIMGIVSIVSIAASISAMTLAGPRVYYAMARDGLFFSRASRVHPRYRTPSVAIIAQAVWAGVLVLSGGAFALINYTGFAVVLFSGLAVAALFVLRRREPGAERPFRVWGYPVTPAIFTIASIAILANALWNDLVKPIAMGTEWGPSAAGLIVIAAGLPLYYLFRRRTTS
jgi:APA family basic amino acid/polyamine antiporter